MLEQGKGENPPRYPDQQTLINAAAIAAMEERVTALEADAVSRNQVNETQKLEKDIKVGERWIIRITLTGVIINFLIFLVYVEQLGEMRKATENNTEALHLAQDSFEISDGNFNRTINQTISQTSAELQASHTASSEFKLTRDQLSAKQGAYVTCGVNVTLSPENATFRIGFNNVGHERASNLRGTFTIVERSTTGEKPPIPWPKNPLVINHPVPLYPPEDSSGKWMSGPAQSEVYGENRTFSDNRDVVRDLASGRVFIEIKGSYSYNNGVEDIHTPVCYRYLTIYEKSSNGYCGPHVSVSQPSVSCSGEFQSRLKDVQSEMTHPERMCDPTQNTSPKK